MKKIFIVIALLFSLTLTSSNAVEVAQKAKITGLYVAYFNRAADQDGLDYWTNKAVDIEQKGGDVSSVFKALSVGFATHPTFKSTYDHLNNQAFVALIYRNALGRDGDTEGIAYWTDLLDKGMIRSDMVATFVELSLVTDLIKENYPNLSDEELAAAQLRQDLITNKVNVSLAFTHQLEELSNVEDSQFPENDPAYKASIKIISEVIEDPETVSSTLAFLDSIKESDDQIRDILDMDSIVTINPTTPEEVAESIVGIWKTGCIESLGESSADTMIFNADNTGLYEDIIYDATGCNAVDKVGSENGEFTYAVGEATVDVNGNGTIELNLVLENSEKYYTMVHFNATKLYIASSEDDDINDGATRETRENNFSGNLAYTRQ